MAVARIKDAPTTRANTAYQALRGEILSLQLEPGTQLPIPSTCDRLGISRTTLATALRFLSNEGLVTIAPQAGTTVARFSLSKIRESAFLREAIEVAAVRKVTENPPEGLKAILRKSLSVQTVLLADRAFDRFFTEDESFHEHLIGATGFPGAVQTARTASVAITRARLLLVPEPGRAEQTVEEHSAIVTAIASGNPSAAGDAMRGHLRQMLDRLHTVTRQRPEFFEEDTA